MALERVETLTLSLEVYDHDRTPKSNIKAIALDSKTRYVSAEIHNGGQTYDVGQNTGVTLTIIRPDKTGVQVTGETFQYAVGEGETVYGAYAELTQTALAVSGTLQAQFMFTSGEQIIRSEIFTINNGVALDATVSEWADEYQGYNLDELVQSVNTAVATVEGMESDVTDLKEDLNYISKYVPVDAEFIAGAYDADGVIFGTTTYRCILIPVSKGEKYKVKTWMKWNIAPTQYMDANRRRISIPIPVNQDYGTNPYIEGVVTIPDGVSYLNVNCYQWFNPQCFRFLPNDTEDIENALLTDVEITATQGKTWTVSNNTAVFTSTSDTNIFAVESPVYISKGSYIITDLGVSARILSQKPDGTWIYAGVSEQDWRRTGTYKAEEDQKVYLVFRRDSVGVSDVNDFIHIKATNSFQHQIDAINTRIDKLFPDTIVYTNWQNGTIPNSGNAYAVNTVDFIPVLPEDIVTVSINKAIADDEVYGIGGGFYNSSYGSVKLWDISLQNTERSFKVPRNAVYAKFSIARYKINSAYGTPLRAASMEEGDVIIAFDKYKSAIDRNKDALPMVDAAVNRGFSRECFSALICTDLHGDIGRTSAWMRYLNNSDIVNVGICLGDIANSYYTDTDGTWYTDIVKQATKNVYTVIGNHDNWKATATGNSFTKWIQPTLTQIGISNLTTPYYAVNRTDYPISIIALYNYDHPSNTAVTEHGEIDTMSQSQLDWFVTALSNVPVNNTLLIVRHAVTAGNTPVSCAFSQPNSTVSGNGSVYGTQPIIEKIVNAWMNGTSINESFSPASGWSSYPTLTVSADFTNRGTGKFAGYAVGHTHSDTISKITAFPNQNIFCFAASSSDMVQQQNADLPRSPADKTIDAITVMAIDTAGRMVKLVRIGSDVTTNMTSRKMIAIPY